MTEFIRFFFKGNGQFSVTDLIVHKFFDEKFKKPDFQTITANITKDQTQGTGHDGGFVDVPVGLMYDKYELRFSAPSTLTHVYLVYNGTFFEHTNREEIEQYKKLIKPKP